MKVGSGETVAGFPPRDLPRFAVYLLALLCLPACTTALEGTLEITTTAEEVLEKQEKVELNPMGDRLILPDAVETAHLQVGTEAPKPVPAGAKVELILVETEQAPGVESRLRVDGKEWAAVPGRIRVRLDWRKVMVRRLPPKIDSIPLSLEAGEALAVDRRVMYVPLPGSRLRDVKTVVRIGGTDRDRLRWVAGGPIVDGRVVGRVLALKEEDR
ncbi:MAG: hypothetical protein ACYTHM_10375 [Planctomycetota bacterium]